MKTQKEDQTIGRSFHQEATPAGFLVLLEVILYFLAFPKSLLGFICWFVLGFLSKSEAFDPQPFGSFFPARYVLHRLFVRRHAMYIKVTSRVRVRSLVALIAERPNPPKLLEGLGTSTLQQVVFGDNKSSKNHLLESKNNLLESPGSWCCSCGSMWSFWYFLIKLLTGRPGSHLLLGSLAPMTLSILLQKTHWANKNPQATRHQTTKNDAAVPRSARRAWKRTAWVGMRPPRRRLGPRTLRSK